MNSFGQKFRLTIFGESHGECIGLVIDGLDAGTKLDLQKIKDEMRRRAPAFHKNNLSTSRNERDDFEIVSGIGTLKGHSLITNGNPLTAIIKNTDTKSKDYSNILRPSHGDITNIFKSGKFAEIKGGGHYSGRMTAPLVFAGAIAKQMIGKTKISSKLLTVGSAKKNFEEVINDASSKGDSVGGKIQVIGRNVPSGIGDPFFNSFESVFSHLAFSIPAIKSVSFGDCDGFENKMGSCVNDEMRSENGKIKFLSNNNGGVLAGITTGQDIVATVIVKPTPSIFKKQKSVKYANNKFQNADLRLTGRHDPAIVLRVMPVLESVMAITILEMSSK